MPELPTGFWSGWIVVLTLTSLGILLWVVLSIYATKDEAQNSLEEEPVWDESLREGSNSPPLWWFWMLLAAMVFSLIYLIMYPGLGSYSGVLNWSQGSRLAESYAEFEEIFAGRREQIANTPIISLQNDSELMELGERIFARECAACHGTNGRGQASLFPNLKDVDWQWGGSATDIETTIRHGRNARMISWKPILQSQQIADVAEYIQTLGTLSQRNQTQSHPGKVVYDQTCVACHGATGNGNPALGAPNLADDIWLYGGSSENIISSIADGRNGVMPAFNERLDDAQIHLLVALLAR